MSEPRVTVREEEAEASARRDVARRGRALYEAKLKAALEPAYNNRFVAIHPDSGEYVVADSTGNAMRSIRKSRPQGRLYLTKIGPEPEYGLAARILMADMMAGKQMKSPSQQAARYQKDCGGKPPLGSGR